MIVICCLIKRTKLGESKFLKQYKYKYSPSEFQFEIQKTSITANPGKCKKRKRERLLIRETKQIQYIIGWL